MTLITSVVEALSGRHASGGVYGGRGPQFSGRLASTGVPIRCRTYGQQRRAGSITCRPRRCLYLCWRWQCCCRDYRASLVISTQLALATSRQSVVRGLHHGSIAKCFVSAMPAQAATKLAISPILSAKDQKQFGSKSWRVVGYWCAYC